MKAAAAASEQIFRFIEVAAPWRRMALAAGVKAFPSPCRINPGRISKGAREPFTPSTITRIALRTGAGIDGQNPQPPEAWRHGRQDAWQSLGLMDHERLPPAARHARHEARPIVERIRRHGV